MVNGNAPVAAHLSSMALLEQLNKALATEIVGILRNRRHYYLAQKIRSPFADEFLTHSKDVVGYAEQFADRITQLGGEPNLSPDGLAERSFAEYGSATTIPGMMADDLESERTTIQRFGELVRRLGNDDHVTRTILANIIAIEKNYTNELALLIDGMLPAS